MTFWSVLAASVVGVLSFSSGVVADEHVVTRRSKAKCAAISIGFSKVENEKAIAKASAQASAYICNGETGVSKANAIASATAEAFALAVAAASVACELEGDASVQVDASASAIAAANIWIAAYASAFASAGDCDECDAYAASFGYVEKEVFLKAVASASIHLKEYTTAGNSLIFKVSDYQSELKRVATTAFAKAIAAAADFKKKEGCLAWVNAGGCIYNPDDPDASLPDCGGVGFECEALAVSGGAIKEIDAVAEASSTTAAFACGDSVSIAHLETTAQALAEATAVAISYAYASCDVDGGYACAAADTEIEQTAKAVARAYADSLAVSLTCNGKCFASVKASADVVGSVLVKAATDAYAGLCKKGGHWTVSSLSKKIVSGSLCALAKAVATSLSAAPNTCLASGIVYADASQSKCPPPPGY